MFDALEVSLQVLEQLIPIGVSIRKHNASLGKQLGRASESVALNIGEGRDRCDGDQRRHYEMAAGSAGELTAALRIAMLKGYITRDEYAQVDVLLDRVRAMLWKMRH